MHHIRFLLITLLMATFFIAGAARADVRLAGVFGDHMVLQRRAPIPVWGWADAGEKITVRIGERTATAVAGEDGRWRVELTPLEASAEPADLAVTGKSTATIHDVLIGQGW